jgi:VanZ family protein
VTLLSVPRRRLALAVAAAVALVMAAPFLGELRSQLRAAFPSQFTLIVKGIVGVSLLVALIVARVRERRAMRYGAMGVAVALAAAYALATGSMDPNIFWVEAIHFIQYGIITFLFYRIWRDRGDWSSLVVPSIAAFIVGIAEEGYQWFLPARVGELNDVWLNGVAIGCGLLFSLGATPLASFSRRWQQGSPRLILRVTAVAVLALAAFVHVVHLGVEIRDPDAGVFDSRYTAAQLETLDQERAAVWKVSPPLVRPPRFSREDQFMTEGLQHVQERNKAWGAGRADTAWRENLILERYFPSVLDTPSYVAKNGHRWSAEHRADAETQVAGAAGAAYVSAAYPYPIYIWPPLGLWGAVLVLAALLWWAEPILAGGLRRK